MKPSIVLASLISLLLTACATGYSPSTMPPTDTNIYQGAPSSQKGPGNPSSCLDCK